MTATKSSKATGMTPSRHNCSPIALTFLCAFGAIVGLAARCAVAADTAVLEIVAPRGARVLIDGKDCTGQSQVSYVLGNAGAAYCQIDLALPDGHHIAEKIHLRSGWRVPFYVRPESGDRPTEVQVGHATEIWRLQGSDDGKRILSMSLDGTVILWNGESGEELRRWSGYGAALSHDGSLVATVAMDFAILLWDAKTGRPVGRLVGHTAGLNGMGFSANGKLLVTAGALDGAVVWDIPSGKRVATLDDPDERFKGVLSATFNKDADKVLTTTARGKAVLWDAHSGAKIRTVVDGDRAIIGVLSPDGLLAATIGRDDGAVEIWNAATGEKVRAIAGNKDGESSVAFSPDGKYILTGSGEIWSVRSGEKTRVLSTDRHESVAVGFIADGQQAILADGSSPVVYDVQRGTKIRAFAGRTAAVNSVAFSPGGKAIATGSRRICLWEADSAQALKTLGGFADDVRSLRFSANGHELLAPCDKTAVLWDINTRSARRKFAGHQYPVVLAAFSSDEKRVLTCSYKTAAVWDSETGKKLSSIPGDDSAIWVGTLTRDGKWALTGGANQKVLLWDALTGKLVRTVADHRDPGRDVSKWNSVGSVEVSPDSSQVLTGSDDHTAALWDIESGRKIRSFLGHAGDVRRAVFSPGGREVATASEDLTAALWDAGTGVRLLTFDGHTGAVNDVAFSPDGSELATASRDGTVRIWSAATGQELLQLISLDEGKEWLAVTPEGVYDGSESGRKAIRFRVGAELRPAPADRSSDRYFHSGLLHEILAGHAVAPR